MEQIKTLLRSLMLILASLLVCTSARAESIAVIDMFQHKSGDSTGDQYRYYRDYTRQLSFEEVLNTAEWKTPKPGNVNRGFSEASSWMQFALKNPSPQAISLILEYVDASAARIEVYHRPMGSDGEFKSLKFTFNKPVSTRPVSFYRPAFPIDISANQTLEVYIHIYQGFEFPMHSFTKMRIWEEADFYRSADIEMALLILLLVVEIIMGITTLFVFFSTRDTIFLYYTCFAFSAASLFAGLSGVWSYFITPNYYELWMVVLQINICQFVAILFVRRFLNIDEHLPKIDKLLLSIVAIDIVGVILNLFGEPYLSRIIIDYTAFAYLLLAPIGLYAHKQGVPHALLFTGSWIIFIVGMALASLRYRGYIADTPVAEWLIYFGGFFEVFLLTTVMVLRIKDLQREKRSVEESYKRHLENEARELSLKIEQQTVQLQEARDKAEHEARTDILTGMANRRSFFEAAELFIQRAKRNESRGLYLLSIDIDHFKRINDTYGHSAGDKVLQNVSQALSKSLRAVDFIARIGGEEFAILVEHDSVEGIAELSRRILETVRNIETEYNGETITVTISVGLAAWNNNTLHNLMQQADEALYKSKQQGRDQISTAELVRIRSLITK